MVAADVLIAERRHAFSPQPDLGIRLGSRLHLILHISVYGLNMDRTAQRRRGEGNRNRRKDRRFLTLKYGMSGNRYLDQQIAPLASVGARLSLSGDPDALSVVDSGRDRNLDLLSRRNITASIAVRALFPDDLSRTMAVGTGLYILYLAEEGLLRINDFSFSVAFRTGDRRRSRLGSGSMTLGALVL